MHSPHQTTVSPPQLVSQRPSKPSSAAGGPQPYSYIQSVPRQKHEPRIAPAGRVVGGGTSPAIATYAGSRHDERLLSQQRTIKTAAPALPATATFRELLTQTSQRRLTSYPQRIHSKGDSTKVSRSDSLTLSTHNEPAALSQLFKAGIDQEEKQWEQASQTASVVDTAAAQAAKPLRAQLDYSDSAVFWIAEPTISIAETSTSKPCKESETVNGPPQRNVFIGNKASTDLSRGIRTRDAYLEQQRLKGDPAAAAKADAEATDYRLPNAGARSHSASAIRHAAQRAEYHSSIRAATVTGGGVAGAGNQFQQDLHPDLSSVNPTSTSPTLISIKDTKNKNLMSVVSPTLITTAYCAVTVVTVLAIILRLDMVSLVSIKSLLPFQSIGDVPPTTVTSPTQNSGT